MTSDPWNNDTDSDGLTDGQEFENATHPNDSDTDGDGMTDLWELTGPAPSDPCGIEGTPPNLSDLKVETEEEWEWQSVGVGILAVPVYVRTRNEIKVTVTATDNVGLDWIRFHIDGKGEETVNFAQYTNNSTATVFFDHSFWSKWVSGYDLNITVSDVNGNEGYMEFHIDSVLEAFVQWLIGQVTALAEFVMELASAAIEWIWDFTQQLILKILDPLIDAVYIYLNDISNSICNGHSDFNNNGEISAQTMGELESSFLNPFFLTLSIIVSVVLLIIKIIGYFLPFIQFLLVGIACLIITVLASIAYLSSVNEEDVDMETPDVNLSLDPDSLLSGFLSFISNEEESSTRSVDSLWAVSLGAATISVFLTAIAYQTCTAAQFPGVLFLSLTIVFLAISVFLVLYQAYPPANASMDEGDIPFWTGLSAYVTFITSIISMLANYGEMNVGLAVLSLVCMILSGIIVWEVLT